MVACGITIIDNAYAVCVNPLLQLLCTRPTKIALEGIRKILAVGETIACYIYAAVVDHQLSKVHPVPWSSESATQQPSEVCAKIE